MAVVSGCASWGVVEGFYWRKENAYQRQWGEYTHAQRRQLLKFMAVKGLNVYVYDPKTTPAITDRHERTMTFLAGDLLKKWKKTLSLAKELKIDFIWSISPPDQRREGVKKIIEQILEIGAGGIALAFDDTAPYQHDSLSTELGDVAALKDEPAAKAAIARQKDQILYLWTHFGNKIKAYVPPCYKGHPRKIESLLQEMDIGIPKAIPFVFTGLVNIDRTFDPRNFPAFSDRKIIVWDNWVASDALRWGMTLPCDRQTALLSKMAGYWLNLTFPLETVFPVVSSICFLKASQLLLNEERHPELLLREGGVADEWAQQIGCFSHFTKAVLKAHLVTRGNMYEIDPATQHKILTSNVILALGLLAGAELKHDVPIMTGKTLAQLKAEVLSS